MTRGTKKFTYGIFYISLFFILVIGGYILFGRGFKRTEQIKNETLKEAMPLYSEGVSYFNVGLRSVSVTGEIVNPNLDFGVYRALYVFKILGVGDKVIETVPQEVMSIFPQDRRVVYSSKISSLPKEVHGVLLEIQNVDWRPANYFPLRDLRVREDVTITASGDLIRIFGTLKNQSAFDLSEVELVTVLRDEFGFKYFVAGAFLKDVQSFNEKEFVIDLPFDQGIYAKTKTGKIEILVYQITR